MFYEESFTEERYTLNVNDEQKEIYMISFSINDQPCFRVFVNGNDGNLFTWDQLSATLQQMDGKEAIDNSLHEALSDKLSKSIVLPGF